MVAVRVDGTTPAPRRSRGRVGLLHDRARRARPVLSPGQVQAAAACEGPLLVLGGPGTGKSTAMRAAMVARINEGADPGRVLGITASASAAGRWRADLAGRVPAVPRIGTVHAIALRMVEEDAALRGDEPPRLLSADDRERSIAEIVGAMDPAAWPEVFREAAGSRAFAARVADFLNRAANQGMVPGDLVRHPGAQPWWPLLAQVWRRYLEVCDLAGVVDYHDVLGRAARLADPARWEWVIVDEYQELDRAQLRLVRELSRAAAGRILAGGDPDQSVYRFRGADPTIIATFADDHRIATAAPPRIMGLDAQFRHGRQIAEALRPVAAALPLAGIPAATARRHRLTPGADRESTATVLTFPSAPREADHVSALLRRFALLGRPPGQAPRWRDAAVIVRTSQQAAAMEQALLAADVPVRMASGERWLAAEPVVAILRDGLEWALRWADGGAAAGGSAAVGPDRVAALLASPMGGGSPEHIQALARQLRAAELATARRQGGVARSAGALLAAAVCEPDTLAGLSPTPRAVDAVDRLHARLAAAADRIEGGAPVAEPLWELWSDDPRGPGRWAAGLRQAALRGDALGSSANRQLDAVLALFGEAERSQARGGSRGVREFLADLPGMRGPDDRVSGPDQPRNAVSILTAHRAKDQEWPLVVVAGVQEEVWPGSGGGAGLLGEDLLDADPQLISTWGQALTDERRLFLLACSRAQRHLVVTAVAAEEVDARGSSPSRFLAELGVEAVDVAGAPGSPLTAVGLVGELRRAAHDPSEPASVKQAALAQLGAIAGCSAEDPRFAVADPAHWWGYTSRTTCPQPLWPPDAPLALSVTGLQELAQCPWRWLLTRVLQASPRTSEAAAAGIVMHRISEAWANGELPVSREAAAGVVDHVWRALDFAAPWQSAGRRLEVAEQVDRLLAWFGEHSAEVAFAERSFTLPLAAGADTISLRGKADLGLVGADGRLAIIDLKTARQAPSGRAVAEHVQLGSYTRAAREGAFAEPDSGEPEVTPRDVSGAALLFPAIPEGRGSAAPKILWQAPADPDEDWLDPILADTAHMLREELFPPRPPAHCGTCPVQQLCPARNPGQGVAP